MEICWYCNWKGGGGEEKQQSVKTNTDICQKQKFEILEVEDQTLPFIS
jgi:hypothetical protein